MSDPWPKVTKTASYTFNASHDLGGVTSHADGLTPHVHKWIVTLIFSDWEMQPNRGYTYDEPKIDAAWGKRVLELEGTHLNDLMPNGIPPTAENVACWLLFDWLPRLSDQKLNFEVSAVRVRKCDRFEAEVNRSQGKRWQMFFETRGQS